MAAAKAVAVAAVVKVVLAGMTVVHPLVCSSQMSLISYWTLSLSELAKVAKAVLVVVEALVVQAALVAVAVAAVVAGLLGVGVPVALVVPAARAAAAWRDAAVGLWGWSVSILNRFLMNWSSSLERLARLWAPRMWANNTERWGANNAAQVLR